MDTEQNTDTEAGDTAGLLDRFDELFQEDGSPREGTEALLDEDYQPADEADASTEESEDAPEAEAEAEAEDATEATESDPEEQEEQEEPEAEAEEESSSEDVLDGYKIPEGISDADKDILRAVAQMAHDPHAGVAFGKVKLENKQLRQQLEEAKTNGGDPEALAEYKLKAERSADLEAKLQKLENQLAVVDYKTTPMYEQEVDRPMASVKQLASTIESTNGLDEGAVLNAIMSGDQHTQNAAIEAIIDSNNLTRRDENRMFEMADKVLELKAREEALSTEAAEKLGKYKEMQVSQQAQQREQFDASRESSINTLFSEYEGVLPGYVENDGTPNQAWDDLRSDAQSIRLENPTDHANASFAMAAMPGLLDQISQLSSTLQEKNALLARMTKAKPTKETSTTPAAAPKSNDSDTFMDRLSKLQF